MHDFKAGIAARVATSLGTVLFAAGLVGAAAPTGPAAVTSLTRLPIAALRVPDIAGRPIPFGSARYFGALSTRNLHGRVVAMATGPRGRGYWIVTSTGGVFTYGSARFHGSATNDHVGSSVVGITTTPTRSGYWLATSTGGVYTFGHARYHGSAARLHLRAPVVGITATPDGGGYWLVAADGGVFTYGDARYHGSAARAGLHSPVTALASSPDGRGYWLVDGNGYVLHYGDARPYGSATGNHDHSRVIGIAAFPGEQGYWLVAANGAVFTFGHARFEGSAAGSVTTNPIISVATTPDGRGYWLLPTTPPPAQPAALPPPAKGYIAGHATAIGDSVMIDAQPNLQAAIPGIDVEAVVGRQWDGGVALAQQLKSEGRLGAIVVIDLGTNGPVSAQQFANMMNVLAGASRVVFVTVHLPPSYSWWQSVNATLEQGVPKYSRDRLADFDRLADANPQWFGSDGVHMPIGGAGAQAMAQVIKAQV